MLQNLSYISSSDDSIHNPMAADLPCDGNGVCMICKSTVPETEVLTCITCATPWHAICLTNALQNLSEAAQWNCPDCTTEISAVRPAGCGGGLVEMVRAIECDDSMTDKEKAQRRQELLSGRRIVDDEEKEKEKEKKSILEILGEEFNCSICMHLLEKPVTTPCGHNFCLKCFQKMPVHRGGMISCASCRSTIPPKMSREPRINSAIVMAIRMAKLSHSDASQSAPKEYHFIHNQDRPDKAFTTERAKRNGLANAASGRIFVTVPDDYFGPISAEYDPERNRGVLVGDTWANRMECRQWGAHFNQVGGINGQEKHGAQSVALSGGYEDDEDHGEWFLYTGSGGRDLSGNKRTSKKQSFAQKFVKFNQALRVSCLEGYPVRVVRTYKEKRSSYAPQEGVRYDGVYRVEKSWAKPGKQGHVVCRYLFVRCDNEPAPWTSDTHGDRPRPLPVVRELEDATDIVERKESPAWDYDEEQGLWMWKKPQPKSRKVPRNYSVDGVISKKRKRQSSKVSVKARLLKEFSCRLCKKVMALPVTTPCAHNFCKACIEGAFAGQSLLKDRTCGGRTLRTQKSVMQCPTCKTDISDFLQNRELTNVIESLQNQEAKEKAVIEEIEDKGDEEGDGMSEDADDESADTEISEESNRRDQAD